MDTNAKYTGDHTGESLGEMKREEIKKYNFGGVSYFDYKDLMGLIGTPIVLEFVGEYSGDCLCLLKLDDGSFAYLEFGYGSCMFCDALEACRNAEDVRYLTLKLFDSMQIFSNFEDAKKWINERDWEGLWVGYDSAAEFIKKVNEIKL